SARELFAISFDRDGDGVIDTEDVCRDVADAGQEDTDGDGRGDACDCAPADPSTADPPPALRRLDVAKSGAATAVLAWTAAADPTEVLSGSLADLLVSRTFGGACQLAITVASTVDDSRPSPAASDGWWYLVRVRGTCAGRLA